MIKAIFFDAGHTLLRAWPGVGEIYAAEAAALGATVEPDRLYSEFSDVFARNAERLARDSLGMPASDEQDRRMWRDIVRQVHARVPELKPVDPEEWFVRLYDRFGRPEHWRPYPDALPALESLRERGFKLGIVSNWSTNLRRILKGTGMESRLDFAVISSELGVRKPNGRIFRAALERAGVRPDEAAHVGDQVEDDVLGAAAIGIQPVLLWRKPEAPPPVSDGVLKLEDLRELPTVLASAEPQRPEGPIRKNPESA